MEEGKYEEPVVSPTYDISTNQLSYLASLQHLVIKQNNAEQITEFETAPCPPNKFHSNWAQYSGNTRFGLKTEITIELHKIYMRGKGWG